MPRKPKSDEVWIVQGILWMSTEDIFEEGEQPDTTQTVMAENDVGVYPSFKKMKQGLVERFGLPKDRRAWGVYDDEPGRIDVQFLVDENNSEASDSEIERWKRGDMRLWSAYVIIRVAVGVARDLSPSSLTKKTGIPKI